MLEDIFPLKALAKNLNICSLTVGKHTRQPLWSGFGVTVNLLGLGLGLGLRLG